MADDNSDYTGYIKANIQINRVINKNFFYKYMLFESTFY